MPTLYLNRQSLGVRLEGEHLVVTDHAAEREGRSGKVSVPLEDVERVVILGEPAVTFPVLSEFLRRAVPCVFLSGGGRWRGELSSGVNLRADRRLLQYKRAADRDFAERAAVSLVAAKAENGRRVLRRLMINRGERPSGGRSEKRPASGLHLRPRDLAQLRGLEGMLARRHFASLRRFFPQEMRFFRRERHPPRDPANAVLSFAYTLLMGELTAMIRMHGLDPAAGFFHVTDGRRPALALDLMEPFRPICGDLLAVSLCSHRILTAERHFRRREDGAVLLNDEGRGKVLTAFSERLAGSFTDPALGCRTTLRGALERTVTDWAAALESGEAPAFFRLP